MGRVAGPFGVLGWVKVQPFSERRDALGRYGVWWLGEVPGSGRAFAVEATRLHGKFLLAKLVGVTQREEAAALKGSLVVVPREALPELDEDEYYWTDLIGLEVVNRQGVVLGRVKTLMETGANDVLVVRGDRERLLPFIRQVILEVNLAAGVIRVDWEVD